MKDLSNKVAVVTGAGSEHGIGFATARLLARRGASVVVADIDQHAAACRAEELRVAGATALAVHVDVADYESVQALAAVSRERFGNLHVVFLNAGVPGGNSLLDSEIDSWRRVLGVNLLGVLHGIKAFVPALIEQGEHAHVIATGSVAGVTGAMYTAAGYTVSKQAVWGLMECLHGQLRDAQADVRATLLLPPLVRTGLGGPPEAMEEADRRLRAAGVPSALASPDEVAGLVLAALTEDAFWAHLTHDQDADLTGSRFTTVLDWENEMIRHRADAVVNRSAPDPYLWGT